MGRYLSSIRIDDIAMVVSLYFANKFNDDLPMFFDIEHKDNEIIVESNILNNYGIRYQMNKDNFGQYCNLLTNTNTFDIKSIRLGMGLNSIGGCKAVITSPQLYHKKDFRDYFIFKHNEINDDHTNSSDVDDWEECYKRLILYLEKVTNHELEIDGRDNDKFDIDDIDIDYEELPFEIYPISRQTYKNKILNKTIDRSKIRGLRKLCSPDEDTPVEDYPELEDLYDDSDYSTNGKECYLYVEDKQYFIVKYSNSSRKMITNEDECEFEWHPRKYEPWGEVENWENEYKNLLKYIRDTFGLVEDDSLILKTANDDLVIEDADQLCCYWPEIEDDPQQFKTILVDAYGEDKKTS